MSEETNTEIVDNENTVLDTDGDKEKPAHSDSDKRLERLAQKDDKLQNILDEYDLDIDDLGDYLKEGKSLKGLIGDRDAKTLEDTFKKADTLDQYNEHWAKEQEKKKREGEDESDTVNRLGKELKEMRTKFREKEKADKSRSAEQAKAEAEKHAIEKFNKTVTDIVKDSDIPDNVRPYLEKYLGVKNPFNEINIGSRRESKEMANKGVEAFNKLQQVIIKNYKDGKTKIPDVKDTGTEAPEKKDKKIRNTKDAKKVMDEYVAKLFKSKL